MIIQLPDPHVLSNALPDNIIHNISSNITNFQDLINFSLINKSTYNSVSNDSSLWIGYLKTLDVWKNSNNQVKMDVGIDLDNDNEPKLADLTLTPINCLSKTIDDPNLARDQFISIYSNLSPIITDVLIKNYTNFQNLNIFKKYNNPINQAKLFCNISNFLVLFKENQGFSNMIIRLNTILNLFIDSVIREIDLQLNQKNFLFVYNLIKSLDCLNINLEDVSVDPLESILEYFMNRYTEDYGFLMDDSIIQNIFKKVDGTTQLRGVVKGYLFNFKSVDDLFIKISNLLNDQIIEIKSIFENSKSSKNVEIDEVPIILKVIETFLGSYLIGGLIDKIFSKAKQIDSSDEIKFDLNTKELDNNLTNKNGNSINSTNKDNNLTNRDDNSINKYDTLTNKDDISTNKDDISTNKDDNPNINIMNEDSLFFQSVPYIHIKLVSTLKNLKYPDTVIYVNKDQTSKMNYIKVVCEFVNFYYEQYLVEFSEELPRQCHQSMIYLVRSWEMNKVDTQKKLEFDILKLVEDDMDDKKSGFEIFSTFTNLFNFKKSATPESTNNENGNHNTRENNNNNNNNNGINENGESKQQRKLTKVAAKLEILTSKVENIKSLVSMDLTVLILQHIKNSYDLLLGLTEYSTTNQINKQLYVTCSNIFIDMLNILTNQHIKSGFNEALTRLRNYNPLVATTETTSTLEPLNNFIELVDVGDLILQMINIFYDRELVDNGIVSKKRKNKDFLNMNSCEKSIKQLETILDNYVANGLDISIGVIMNEITINIEKTTGPLSLLSNSKTSNRSTGDSVVYDIEDVSKLNMNKSFSSNWCNGSINIMSSHFKLLQDSIDKSILDVFKEEIGERFMTLFIKVLLKKFIISINGAIQFNFDINVLYNFFQNFRVKPTVAYLVSFKQIDQLFLIDCSQDKKQCKELGKLVMEIGRDNGIFTPEEVYQFVTRRSDWLHIKGSVDKVVYGFGADDCVIV